MSVGVTAIYVDLCILSILAVRLPKLAVGAHLELIRSRGRRGVLNLLFWGVRGCPWVSVGVRGGFSMTPKKLTIVLISCLSVTVK